MDTEVTWWMQLIIAAAGIFGTPLMVLLGRFLDKLFDYFAQKTKLAFLANVDEVIMGSVVATFNAGVEQAKAAAADGKLTPEEKKRFAAIPLEQVKKHFKMRQLVKMAGKGLLNEFLAERVEKAVTISKNVGKAARARPNP